MPGMNMVELPHRTTGIALIDRSSTAELGRFVRAMALLWCIASLPILFWSEFSISPLFAVLSLVILPVYYVARRDYDAIALMAAMAFFLTSYIPTFSSYLNGDLRPVAVMLVVLPWLAVAEHWARRITPPIFAGWYGNARPQLLLLLFWLLVAMAASLAMTSKANNPAFMACYGLALFHFDRLCSVGKLRVVALIAFAIAIIFYALFIWDKFGRLLFGAMAVMPFLMMLSRMERRPGPLLIGGALPVMIAFSQWVRNDELSSGGIATSSMASPNELSVRLLQSLDWLPVRWSAFWDQISFFYLGWVPRAFWPDKPLGLGLTIVDDLQGRRGMSLEHSEAPGVLGEALWMFGPYAIIGLFVTLMAFLSIALLLRWAMRSNGSANAVLLALFPTLVWGGLASFAARLWLILLPLMFYALLIALIEARRRRKALS